MTKQEVRRETTRSAILAAAQDRFGALGYQHVTVDDIAADARVAKGAIYHHFSTKADLFEAVLQSVASRILADVQSASTQQPDILAAIFAGNRAFFASCANPQFAQIFLKDGPSALGWHRWRKIDESYFGGMVRNGLLAAIRVGVIAERPINPLTRLILGAITEAAIDCANSDDFGATAKGYVEGLEAILNGLRPTPPCK
ncbi:MAG: TetR/AcrR family transcriptional regulator [Sphingomonas sp.]|uniref:TetR/AcrR family transcriptional regulator n=1 Tax=Sphingomonas sp. TaxID=28214 RepID=UPI00184EAABC|nr:TetR/AcrR family transcriptional regulator [Zymomonas sp.]MBA4773668.1 TetR/AcrR family transcriptional regulator [Sphingomonas sp.]